MAIARPIYLQQLINRMNNGMIKIVTGLRRCGKSYLLFELFREYLLSTGVKKWCHSMEQYINQALMI